jgi:glycosyltransferase involved in cell wall biosynthesis
VLVVAEPVVSVVIPTRNRPALAVRAVKSALAQTLAEIEVIVVIDGPDIATVEALSAIKDSRVSVIPLQYPFGGSEARNIGIRKGRGEFIGLLDDDDEWSPDKLTRQLELARQSAARYPVVTCRLIARSQITDEIWPARRINPRESMSDYLLCREGSIRQGEGFIQSSTLFVPRALMLQVQFESGLPRHQDWDWLIRASVHSGVEFLWVWEPLVIYNIGVDRNSVSSDRSLMASIKWVNGNRLVSSKARAYFYATQIAARCKTPATFWSVVCNTMRYPRALLIALGLALTPRTLVHSARRRSVLTHA